ncbi:BTB and MATH domain-containing protein 38-like isoform X2 [Haliotis rufescens]|uniref:BTB and MATH domain-containing protein 38-like isoform X1 n=1 Tax=Haliotis rufescens TaxID=6454 RepID=UPI00201EFD51|nr:BTB and MATH domain-containing protein 38-like isoform X1 [Haliotis rufescens]XP_048251656.1 BTB and MATH domain-containing protein 38-like isoform X2 [Haliotis rufescens]
MATRVSPKRRTSVFDEPSDKTDVALVVEGRRLHVNKGALSAASDVFHRMFKGDFKEKQESEVPLPGKTYDDIVDLLLCIYPSELRPVTKVTVDRLLELADEYQIVGLKRRCEEFLLTLCGDKPLFQREVLHALYLADKHSMPTLLNAAIQIVKLFRFRTQNNARYSLHLEKDFVNLGNETKFKLMTEMIDYFQMCCRSDKFSSLLEPFSDSDDEI